MEKSTRKVFNAALNSSVERISRLAILFFMISNLRGNDRGISLTTIINIEKRNRAIIATISIRNLILNDKSICHNKNKITMLVTASVNMSVIFCIRSNKLYDFFIMSANYF